MFVSHSSGDNPPILFTRRMSQKQVSYVSSTGFRAKLESNTKPYDFLKEKLEPLVRIEKLKEELVFHKNWGNTKAEKKLEKKLSEFEDSSKLNLYWTDSNGVHHKEEIENILGFGGSKRAFQFAQGRALILPNTDVGVDKKKWESVVQEETKVSEVLNRIGLLSPLSSSIKLSFSPKSQEQILAYTSESFENLAKTKDWLVIDRKNLNSSVWKKGEKFVFSSDEERRDEAKWDPIVNSLLTDVVKICLYQIPLSSDAANLAIAKNPENGGFEIRYFGFDFSSKNDVLDLAKVGTKTSTIPDEKKLTEVLKNLLSVFLEFELFNSALDKQQTLNRLVERYKSQLIERAEKEFTAL